MEKSSFKKLVIFVVILVLIGICFMKLIDTRSYKIAKVENNYLMVTEGEVNESGNTSNEVQGNTSGGSSTTQRSNTSSGEARTVSEKSSNANLSMLGIRPTQYDFTGFKMATTTYDVTVPQDVEEVEVYGTAQDSKAKVSGLGTKKLEEGLNDLSIVVTAEDGTEKIYTINVTRGGATEEETNEATEIPGEGLASLKVGNLELSPEFNVSVYEYTAKYIGEETKLDVTAEPSNPEYIVEVTGNDNLQEGENTITIVVTDAEGENVATYQVTVNKSLVDKEAIARQQEEAKQKEEQKKMIIIGVAAGIIVLIIVIALIIKKRRNDAWAEEYTVPYSGLNDDDEDDYQDEKDEADEDNTWTKESARKQFLDDYDNDNTYLDQERASRRKHKGKRFK